MVSPTSRSIVAATNAPSETMEPMLSDGVRVDSLSFCRLECDHSELFLSEYKRSNRTKGLKILRCFPHCCPNHIERSYCGSSLHVIVQTTPSGSGSGNTGHAGSGTATIAGSTPSNPRAKLADSIFLFARFECSTDDGLRVGDTLASSAVVRDTQSEDNAEGTWIPGIRERASALASAMKRVSQAIADHTLVYQLNGKVYSRWYYDWESGANKAQRLMRHVLKAYVFERTGSGDALRVIGIVASPEFTVISYRRAPTEGLAALPPSTSLHASGKPDGAAAASRESSPSMAMAMAGSGRASLDSAYEPYAQVPPKRFRPTSEDALDAETKRRRRLHSLPPPSALSGVASTAPRLVTLRNATPPELFEDRVLWEHANARLVTVSKNLALVFYFVQWTPLDYYASFVDELIHTVNHKVLEPLVVVASSTPDHRLEKLNAFARILLDHAHTQPTSRGRGVAPPLITRELDGLLRAMAQAAIWFYSDDMRWWTRAFMERHAHTLTDKTQLRRAFLQWLVDLEAQLNRVVFVSPHLPSLEDAAEEIIAAVYTHELYHPKRPLVRQILGEHGFIGWRAFVAQMRDSFIAFSSTATRNHRVGLPTALTTNMHPVERAWNGDWAMDVDESAWKPQDACHADGLSLVTVLDLMAQLARVQVTLSLDQRLLCLTSQAAFATAHVEALKLVLDGKSRVFRFSSHGWSTAMGEGSDGDYIGSTRLEAGENPNEPDRLIAYVETFRWSRLPGTRSFHTRLRIECWKQQRLFVNGEVLETVATSGFPRDELPFLPERTIGAKLKMVNRVAVVRGGGGGDGGRHAKLTHPSMTTSTTHASVGGGGGGGGGGGPVSPPTAWRRLGGFRLVYARARK